MPVMVKSEILGQINAEISDYTGISKWTELTLESNMNQRGVDCGN